MEITVKGPDLVIKNQTAEPTTVEVGDEIYITCDFKNIGNAPVDDICYVGYYLSTNTTYEAVDDLIGYDYVYDLAAGSSSPQTENVIIPVGTSPGTYYILYFADPNYIVTESDEDNNVSYTQITVTGGAPDLVVINQTASPTTVEAGSTTDISCDVKNQGSAATSINSWIKYYLSTNTTYEAGDEYLCRNNVISLSPGGVSHEATNAIIPSNTTSGTYYILYFADADEQIAESNETNNVSYKKITVTEPAAITQHPLKDGSIVTNPDGPFDFYCSGLACGFSAGYRFKSDVDGCITELGCWNDYPNGNVTMLCMIWDDEGYELDYAWVTNNHEGFSYNELDGGPLQITAGTYYRAAVTIFDNDAYYSQSYSNYPINVGNITITHGCEKFEPESADDFPEDLYDYFMLGIIDIGFVPDGKSSSDVTSINENIVLQGNLKVYPNPMANEVTIEYSVQLPGNVTIAVYDITGRLVQTLTSGYKLPGEHTEQWNANDENGTEMPNGTYFTRMQTGDNTQTTKVILMR